LNFFGFKYVSGKTVFVGNPEGDTSFLFHEIKIQMSLYGILLLQPGFNSNKKNNFYLSTEDNNLTKEDLLWDVLIQDEAKLSKINDEVQIDKMITIPIIEENLFLDISGNDYKEVVNQNVREWILKASVAPETGNAQVILTDDDVLKEIEKENKKKKAKKQKPKLNKWPNKKRKKELLMVNYMKPKV